MDVVVVVILYIAVCRFLSDKQALFALKTESKSENIKGLGLALRILTAQSKFGFLCVQVQGILPS